MGLWLFYSLRAENETAKKLGEQLLALAETVREPALLLSAHYTLGAPLFLRREMTLSRGHLEQGTLLYDIRHQHSLTSSYGFDPGLACLLWLALALWHQGYPDQALKRGQDALAWVQERAHPLTWRWA
jgi:hypothetical protein